MADKYLASIRKDFVEKASKDVIKQLLDDLLLAGVLNEGEKDSILEENPTRVDKARALIDTVKRKGDESSKRLLVHLQSRDAALYSNLVQLHGEPM